MSRTSDKSLYQWPYMPHSLMKRKLKQWWSSIPPISSWQNQQLPLVFNFKLTEHKKTTIHNVGNSGADLRQAQKYGGVKLVTGGNSPLDNWISTMILKKNPPLILIYLNLPITNVGNKSSIITFVNLTMSCKNISRLGMITCSLYTRNHSMLFYFILFMYFD